MKTKSKKITKKKTPFSKLSKPKKIVAIAKDVLMQIKNRRYIANTGAYITSIKMNEGYLRDFIDQSIKKNFGKIKKCTVCAMGACLMSITKFENKLNFGEVGSSASDLDNPKVKELFSSLFTPIQLLLIERAFEGESGGTLVAEQIYDIDEYESDIKKQVKKCEKFYQRFNKIEEGLDINKRVEQQEKNSEKRLTAIMDNIIYNKGTFKI